jgi:hypothetical protein
MLNENLDACSAAGRVGYESPSQFSREYSRLFGARHWAMIRMRLAQRAVEPRRTPAGPRRRVRASLSDRAASSAADRLRVDR